MDAIPARFGSFSAHNWWMWVLRGVTAILFALTAFFMPGITFAVLILFLGAYLLVDGVFSLISGLRDGRDWPEILEGVLGVTGGSVILFLPLAGMLAVLLIAAAWAIITGVLEIIAAVKLRHLIRGEWLLGASGAVSVLFGLVLVAFPIAGAITLTLLLGAYTLLVGVLLVALGLRLRHADLRGHAR